MQNDSTQWKTRLSLLNKARSSPYHPSWEDLLSYYESFVRRLLVGFGFRGADLEDAQQHVYLKLWNGLKSYDPERAKSGFRGWFAPLIRNAAIDWLRVNRSSNVHLSLEEPRLPEPGSAWTDTEQRIEHEWQSYIVNLALGRLEKMFSEKAFAVFEMSMQGIDATEIAKELGIRVDSVYVLKARFKNRLQREIAALRIDLEKPHERS